MTTRNSSVRGKKDVAVMAKTYEEIAEAFGEYVSELLQIFLLKLDSKGIFDYSKVRMFNIQRSNELLKNLDMVEDKIPVLELSFKSCPYNPDIYAKLLEFGIYDVDSFATAKEFGLETFLNPLVIDLCKKRLENIEKNPELLKILALLRDETEIETIKFLYSKDINDILNEYADKVIECLTATEKPMFSYNNGVLFGEYTPQQIDPNSILNEMNANLYRYEQLSVEQLEAMRNSGTYITPTEESKSDSGEYKLTDETFDISAEDRDRINRMYIGAYTLLDDQRKIMYYALELQKSKEPSMVELGWYTEARAMRDLNLDGWQDQYGSVIKKLRNNILKDPTDINAMILRVRCLIDTEQFDEVER